MTPHEVPSDVINLATSLLQQLGVNTYRSIEPVMGGRNNRAFRICGPTDSWLLKKYFHEAGAQHNRCETEWAFSQFCWRHDVHWGPKPLAIDQSQHAVLFEFIVGRRLQREEVSADHVEQAAKFVEAVNRHRLSSEAFDLPVAAEACFSLEEHISCVERRIDRISSLRADDVVDHASKEWMTKSLIPDWAKVVAQLKAKVTTDIFSSQLPLSGRCLSPSDFGFHNALMTESGWLKFFDFEYAGWDDPAKLVCDFYWQQELPAPWETKPRLIAALADCDFQHELMDRVELLTPVYGIKWCCLLLNEFVAADRRRREFAQVTLVTVDRRHEQLERAKQLLSEIALKCQ